MISGAPRDVPTGELANLDFLRAAAVSLVFGSHLCFTMRIRLVGNLGHLGVLAFFVHTALVLMFSLDRLNLSGYRLYAAFILRRLFRIYPLSVLCVIVAATLHIPSTSWFGVFRWPGWTAIGSNLLLVQNVTHVDSIICVLWSLPFEIQMYLVLPILFLWLSRSSTILPAAVGWLMAVAVAGAEYFVRAGSGNPDALLTRYVPCFFAGIFAWRAFRTWNRRISGRGWVLLLLLLAVTYRIIDVVRVYGPRAVAAAGGSVRNDHAIWWPPFLDLVDDWLFCAVIGLMIPLFHDIRTRWLNAITKRVARYSYGIYICHVPILWLCLVRFRIEPLIVSSILAILLTAIVSVSLYHFVEEPAIRAGKRLAVHVASFGLRRNGQRVPQSA